MAGGSGVRLEPVLVGDQHTAIVQDLLVRFAVDSATGRRVLRPGCGGLVVLSGQSGMGKSRIVREVYRGLRVNQSEPGYWPELAPTGGATVPDGADAGLDVFGFRKSLGPKPEGFMWPAGSVPDFLWWQIGCQQAKGEGFLDAQGLFANELLYHREPAWFGWTRAAGGKRWGKQAKALLPKVSRELGKTVREEGTAAILAEVAGQAVPFGGAVAKALLAIGGAAVEVSDRQMRFNMDTRLGTDTGGRDDPTDLLTAVVSSLAVTGFPVVIAVEDLHDADEPTLELLARLTGPQFADRILVIATGWPEALASRTVSDDTTLQQWIQQVGEDIVPVGPLEPSAVTDLVSGQFPGTAADRVAAISARWTNPLAVALVLDLLAGDGAVHGDAIIATDAQIAEIPTDLAGLYDQTFNRLPQAARRAVILDVICGADPQTGKDFSAVPGVNATWSLVDPELVLDAAASQGLTADSIDHGAAVRVGWLIDEQGWVVPREPGLAAAAWRAIRNHRLRQEAPLVRAQAARLIAARITEAARQSDGTPGLFIRADRWWFRESSWMLTLAPTLPDDPHAQDAAARAALEQFRHQARLRPQDALRTWAPWQSRWETILGPDHPDTLVSRSILARTYQEAGNLERAIPLSEQVLADAERLLGQSNPLVLAHRDILAMAYREAGNLKRAIPLSKQVLADAERLFGDVHPNTLTYRNNLAVTYQEAGKLTLAVPILERVLADAKRLFGADHPEAVSSGNNLAVAYYLQGDLARAIPLSEQVLADSTRVLGPIHPQTMTCRSSLALAYQTAGAPTLAIPLLGQTYTERRRVQGPDHPHTLMALNNLAMAYQESGDLATAIILLEKVLSDSERLLSPDNPQLMASRSNLASAYQAAQDLGRAIPLLERNLADRRRVLGPEHPHTLVSRNNLATAYHASGDLTRAIPLMKRTVADRRRVLGADHPETLISRSNLALAHQDDGNLTRAIHLLRHALLDSERALGRDHPSTLVSRKELATAYLASGDLARAIPLLERTVAEMGRSLGDDNPDALPSQRSLVLAYLQARNGLAVAYLQAEDPDEAVPLLRDVLSDIEQILDPHHSEVLMCRGNLAVACVATGNLAEGIPLLERTLADRRRILGDDHPDTVANWIYLNSAYQMAKDAGR